MYENTRMCENGHKYHVTVFNPLHDMKKKSSLETSALFAGNAFNG